MGIITKSRLTEITETQLGYRSFNEILNEAKRESKVYASATVFLSHSHDDLEKEYVNKAIVFLRRLGIRVYIDSADSSMPPFTNSETAQRIKNSIKENGKFVLLATNNAISSKWCNWELGFGDAHKYLNKIALFPLSENSGSWNGSEYLRIYSRIEESSYSPYFKILYPDGREMSVADWLKL